MILFESEMPLICEVKSPSVAMRVSSRRVLLMCLPISVLISDGIMVISPPESSSSVIFATGFFANSSKALRADGKSLFSVF